MRSRQLRDNGSGRQATKTVKKVLVNGAGGFIGGHLVKRLKSEGCWVRVVDLTGNVKAYTGGGGVSFSRLHGALADSRAFS